MSDKVVLPPNTPAAKKPVEQAPVTAPEVTSILPSTTGVSDAKGSFQVVDPNLKQAQAKIQPPAMESVVPASRAGRKTKEDLKTNLLMGQLSPRSVPRRRAKTGTLARPDAKKSSKVLQRLTPDERKGLDDVMQRKDRIVDQKRRVNERTASEQQQAYQRVDAKYYQPFADSVRCKFVQKAHLPSNNEGVCLAMAAHWAERSVHSKGQEPFSFAAEFGDVPKRLRSKFEDLVADQELADGGKVSKALVRAGVEVVEHRGRAKPGVIPGDRLFAVDPDHASQVDDKVAIRYQLRHKLAQAQADPATAETIAALQADYDAAGRQLDQLNSATCDQWVKQIGAGLGPNRTYVLSFGGGGGGHAVAVRTGPELAKPPADGIKFARLDVMDANLGEFHFDNTTASGNRACCRFLRQWGDEYIVGGSLNRVLSYEIKS